MEVKKIGKISYWESGDYTCALCGAEIRAGIDDLIWGVEDFQLVCPCCRHKIGLVSKSQINPDDFKRVNRIAKQNVRPYVGRYRKYILPVIFLTYERPLLFFLSCVIFCFVISLAMVGILRLLPP